jgi:hypothetical protein
MNFAEGETAGENVQPMGLGSSYPYEKRLQKCIDTMGYAT